jgi:hypothetical protein
LFTGVWQFKEKHELDTEQAALKEQVEQTKLVDQMLDRIERLIDKPSAAVNKSGVPTSTAEGVSIENDSIPKSGSADWMTEEITTDLTEKYKTRILISLSCPIILSGRQGRWQCQHII